MHRHDVRVVQAGEHSGFGKVVFDVLRAADQVAVRHLDGNASLQHIVVPKVDLAAAALAQNLLNAVSSNLRRKLGGVVRRHVGLLRQGIGKPP